MINKRLKVDRKKIDRIDASIFNLIKKRTSIVKHMLSIKRSKGEIVDQSRINEILKKIRKKSIKNKIDPMITNRIWKSMIWSYVKYQKKNYKKK